MKNCILFVYGTYHKRRLFFYKQLCRGKTKVAIDGGYRFFEKTGIKPDFLIGDFDSLKKIPSNLPPKTKVLSYPKHKNKTDSHLALDYCINEGAVDIDIVVPHFGEPDHYLGNLMLLKLASIKTKKIRTRIVNFNYQIVLLENNKAEFNKCVGDTVSVIPLGKRIELSCTGTEYEAKHLKISPGDSRPLRNLITAQNALFHVKGTAFLIHRYHR